VSKLEITIPLDPETARAYDSAAPEEKRKMQALLSLWHRGLAGGDYASLQETLDRAGHVSESPHNSLDKSGLSLC